MALDFFLGYIGKIVKRKQVKLPETEHKQDAEGESKVKVE